MKKEIFRVGDYVTIIEPKFVKRIGYPIHPSDFYEVLKRDPNVVEALKLIGISPEYEDESSRGIFDLRTSLNVPKELVKAIAFIKTRQQGFGGNTRSLHYVDDDFSKLNGEIFSVLGKKVVKTGVRVPPWGGYCSRTDESEYEPGYLADEKTHILLNIMSSGKDYWIETCNVKKGF